MFTIIIVPGILVALNLFIFLVLPYMFTIIIVLGILVVLYLFIYLVLPYMFTIIIVLGILVVLNLFIFYICFFLSPENTGKRSGMSSSPVPLMAHSSSSSSHSSQHSSASQVQKINSASKSNIQAQGKTKPGGQVILSSL